MTDKQWPEDLVYLAQWSLTMEDLRYKMLHAPTPRDLFRSVGVDGGWETGIVLRIFEAARAQGYVPEETIAYEKPYPSTASGNPPRADLAFKDGGVGQGWNYVEVKYYWRERAVDQRVVDDIKKLLAIEGRTTRWMLVYKIRDGLCEPATREPQGELNRLMLEAAKQAGCAVAPDQVFGRSFPIASDGSPVLLRRLARPVHLGL